MSRIAIVRPARKDVPFSVLDIGGEEALKKHRIEQRIKEIKWQEAKLKRDAELRLRSVAMVVNQDATVQFTEEEKAEAAIFVDKTNKLFGDDVAGIKKSQEQYTERRKQDFPLMHKSPEESLQELFESEQKPSLFQRFKNWFSDLLQAAFPQ